MTYDGKVSNFATGLLNFDPTGEFPGTGEQGVSGTVVDSVTGDVYAAMLYDTGPSTGNVHYLTPADAPLHDVLTCIRHRVPLERANGLLRTNAEYYFRSPRDTAVLFVAWPGALQAK